MDKKALIDELYDDLKPALKIPRLLHMTLQANKLLSAKLYDKDQHFVYELLQNADDNQYEKGKKPSLEFCLQEIVLEGKKQTCLLVKNNEKGFSEENVRSLCDIGRSTKVKREGYIGEKGIGFKSVFAITDRPYIYSNGYQFSLPKSIVIDGIELGYVVPVWESSIPFSSKGTLIILPLNDPEKIEAELRNFRAENILFLNKLTSLKIDIDLPENKYSCEIKKEIQSPRIVQLTSLIKKDGEPEEKNEKKYFYCTREFQKPEDINEEERPGVVSRLITIAIPLTSKIPSGEFFAYLPACEDTGLPFIINADFIVPSSRVGIKGDSDWNNWLLSEIPDFFADIMEEAINSTELNAEQKRNVFSKIPLNSYRYSNIVEQIYVKLKKKKIILTFQSDSILSPQESKRLSQEKYKLLTNLNWTPEYMGSKAANNIFSSPELSCYEDILDKLDIEMFKEEIIDFFTNDLLLKADNQQLFEIYKYLRDKDIGNSALIPVDTEQGKRFVSGKLSAVFWNKPQETFPEFSPLNVFFVAKDFWDFLENLQKNKQYEDILGKLEKLLDISTFTIARYCNKLNERLNPRSTIPQDEFILISHFLIANNVYPSYFVTNQGIQKAGDEIKYIVVSEDFDKDFGWQLIWKDKDSYKHFAYLTGYSIEDQKKLLENQQIDKYPLFEIKECSDDNYYSFRISDKALYQEYMNARSASFPKYKATIDYPEIPPSIICIAYLHFLMYYKAKNSFFMVKNRYYGREIQLSDLSPEKRVQLGLSLCVNTYKSTYSMKDPYLRPSNLLNDMKSIKWIYTEQGAFMPAEVWLPTPEIQSVLGNTVPYIRENVTKDIAEVLGIHTTLNLDDLFSLISKYSTPKEEIDIEKVLILYRQIRNFSQNQNSSGDIIKIQSFFTSNASIYIPNSAEHWYNPSRCYLEKNELSDIFGDNYQYLPDDYEDLRSFFRNIIGIKEKLSLKTYLDYWLDMQERNGIFPKEKICNLYQQVFRFYQENEYSEDWQNFCQKAKLLTAEGNFVDRQYFLINDNQPLKEIFSESKEISWHVDFDALSLSELKSFYEEFGVKCLSESVTSSPALAQCDDFEDVTGRLLTPACIAMIAAWISENCGSEYASICPKLLQLKDTPILDIGKSIPITYSLSLGDNTIDRNAEISACWVQDSNIIYADCESENFKSDLAENIADTLLPCGNSQNFSSDIELYLSEPTLRRIERKGWEVPEEFRELVDKASRKLPAMPGNTSFEESDAETNDNSMPESTESAENSTEEKTLPIAPSNYVEKLNQSFQPQTYSQDSISQENENSGIANELSPEELEHRKRVKSEEFRQPQPRTVTVSKQEAENECPLLHFVASESITARQKNLFKKCWDNLSQEQQIILYESIDSQVKVFLEDEYHGECQICHKTFRERDGKHHFNATYLVKRQDGGKSDAANAICLCAEHFAKWQLAEHHCPQKFDELVAEAVTQEHPELHFVLAGEEVALHYTKKHIQDLQTLIEAERAKQENENSDHQS